MYTYIYIIYMYIHDMYLWWRTKYRQHPCREIVGADHRSCPSSGCCRGESQQGLTWSRADEANHKLCWNYLTPNFFSSLKLVSPSPGLLAGILGAVNVWVSVCNRCINKTQQRNCYRVATVDRIRNWYQFGREETSFLDGGFNYFLFSPLFGEDSHFD